MYLGVFPKYMSGMTMDKPYAFVKDKSGKYSDLELITKNLGFSGHVFKLPIRSEEALLQCSDYYQFA